MIGTLERPVKPPAPAGRGLGAKVWALAWPKLLAIAIVLAIWELVHLSGWKHYVFPAPGPTLASLWDQLKTGVLWHAIRTTVQRAVVGFALAVLIGSIVGALVSQIGPVRAAVGSLITGLQTMPSLVWIPFAIILFGINDSAIYFVVVMGAAPSIANGLITGIDYTPPLLLRAGKMMGLRGVSLYRFLILPASLPSFVAGLRQGWAFAWRSLLAGELLVIVVNEPSLGVLLNNDQDQTDIVGATALMIVLLVIGMIAHVLFEAADRVIRRRRGLDLKG